MLCLDRYLDCRETSAGDQRRASQLSENITQSSAKLVMQKFDTVACVTTSISSTRVRMLKALSNILLSLQMWANQHTRTINTVSAIEPLLDICMDAKLALKQEEQFVVARRLEVERDSKLLFSPPSTASPKTSSASTATSRVPTADGFSGYLRHREGKNGGSLKAKRWYVDLTCRLVVQSLISHGGA